MFRTCPTCGKNLSPEEQRKYRCYDCNPPLPDEED